MPGVSKKARLYDVSVNEVTLCGKPAVQKSKFLVMKSQDSDNGPDTVEKEVLFKAKDVAKQIVYGYALVPDVEDTQGDVITAEEIEKTAHKFLENVTKGEATGTGTGLEHKQFEGIGHVVESMIDRTGEVAKSLGIPDSEVIPGGWMVGTHVEDSEVWGKIEKGEITGYSIGGSGKREQLEKSESLFTRIANSVIKACKGGKKKKMMKYDEALKSRAKKSISYNEAITDAEIMEVLSEKIWALWDSIWSIMEDEEVTDKIGEVLTSAKQFVEDLGTASEEIMKHRNPIQGEEPMKPEEIQALTEKITADVTKAVSEKLTADVTKSVVDALKPPTPPEEKPEVKKNEELEELTKSIKVLTEKVEKMEKAPVPRNGEGADTTTTTTVKKATDSPIADGALAGTALSFRG